MILNKSNKISNRCYFFFVKFDFVIDKLHKCVDEWFYENLKEIVIVEIKNLKKVIFCLKALKSDKLFHYGLHFIKLYKFDILFIKLHKTQNFFLQIIVFALQNQAIV